MHSENEQIIGFDAREMWSQFKSLPDQSSEERLPHIGLLWSQDRIEMFLIRSDITKPLSTDTMVWVDVIGMATHLRFEAGIPGNGPLWTGLFDFWENLEELKAELERLAVRQPYWIIAITILLTGLNSSDFDHWKSILQSTTPPSVSGKWTFLGYDVSDAYVSTSGLTNCGHPESDKKWISDLNEYHLFTDIQLAYAYKEEMDKGNTQHAPFYIYGMYLVEVSQVSPALTE